MPVKVDQVSFTCSEGQRIIMERVVMELRMNESKIRDKMKWQRLNYEKIRRQ